MDISSSLIAKGAAGALAASAATAAGVIYKDQIFGKYFDLTKFDQGLVDFLEAGGDIIFEVKKNENDSLSDSDLTFCSSKTLPITVKVSVDASASGANLFEVSGDDKPKGKKSALQKLNGDGSGDGTAWTWSCEIKFEAKEVSSVDGKSIHNKNKIFKSNDQGLFGQLKKNLSTETDEAKKEKAKEIKERFIKNCANERTNNEEIKKSPTLTNNKLESPITIDLKLGSTGDKNGQTDANTLYPKAKQDRRLFREFFGSIS